MLRVYLDQNKWIDLARAREGQPAGGRYRDALAVSEAAVDRGLASFPLDTSRYIETAKRQKYASRIRLTDVMESLSRYDSISPSSVVLPAGLDVALHKRFGRPAHAPAPVPFGRGVSHAPGGRLDAPRLDLPEGLPLAPGQRAQLDVAFAAVWVRAALVGPAPSGPQPPTS